MSEGFSVGARWWRVDFHAHSPASYDFGADEGSISHARPTFEDWLLTYMASDIDALVITDHNSHEGIDQARAALKTLRDQANSDYREITLFPGVELSTPGGIHLLAVFDPAEDSDTVNGLLHKCGFRGDRGTSSHTTVKSFTDVVHLVLEAGGIPIPAHVDSPAGLLGMASTELAGIERDDLVTIVEYTAKDTTLLNGRTWIPILGSDAHHLDATGAPDPSIAKFPGSHFTWVKMSTPTLAGLRAAFSDGDASLIRSISSSVDPNDVNHNAVRSIRIKHQGVDRCYTFSQWMNALIGGRGTGKSTIIEVARLVMDRFDELPNALKSDLLWYSTENSRSNGSRFWDTTTEVEIEYSRPTGLYRVSWFGSNPGERRIEVYSGSDWVIEEGAVSERFPILVSSQKQIFELSKDPKSLLSLVDSLTAVDYPAWERQNVELRATYRTLRSSMSGLRQKLADESTLRGNLIDADDHVNKLRALRDSPEAQELDTLVSELRAQAQLDEAGSRFSSEVNAATAAFDAALKSVSLKHPIDSSEETWRDLVTQSVDEIRAIAEALTSGLASYEAAREISDPREEKIRALRDFLNHTLDGSADFADVEKSEDETRLVVSELEPSDSALPLDAYDVAVSRRDDLQQSLVILEQARKELDEVELRAAAALDLVVKWRKELFDRRSRVLSGLASATISMKLYPFADKTRVESDLRSITQRATGFDSIFEPDGIRRVVKSDARNPSYPSELASLKTVLKEIGATGESRTLQAVAGRAIDQRFISHVQGLDDFEYELAVDLWFPEDYLEVRYSDSPGKAKMAINLGSPGQRTAALLAVMLRLGDQPLLLDQPEDDIDNLLIYELVVKTIREAKLRRQVVIATHNANIVVNGDAENVMVLESGALPELAASGAIQEDSVRDLICRVMEGGQTAFQARYKRLVE